MFHSSSDNTQQFVQWFREVSPYIHSHRGRTFVISFAGEALDSPQFHNLIQDITLLNSLGIRLVLVHGVRPQIEHHLRTKGLPSTYFEGIRITDAAALQCVKAACGEVRAEIESLLSKGLTNYPTSEIKINTSSGNFIVARPVGIRKGVDYGYTGEVRRVEITDIIRRLDNGSIVLCAPLGYSPTGETFNLLTEEVAMEVAIALRASKWICLIEAPGLFDNAGQLLRQLTVAETQTLLTDHEHACLLDKAMRACQKGVPRIHLVSRQIEGSLLLELFSRDGVGTLISNNPFEPTRKATIEDVGGILELIAPLEEAGILVKRSREKLEIEINCFTIQTRDGMVTACAALYPFIEDKMAELACLAVHPHYRREQRGDALLACLEQEALQLGIRQIFVLTTHTAHWFQERGFINADVEQLPMLRRRLYNYQRCSKVFIKTLNK